MSTKYTVWVENKDVHAFEVGVRKLPGYIELDWVDMTEDDE